jgi:hypothetical protein
MAQIKPQKKNSKTKAKKVSLTMRQTKPTTVAPSKRELEIQRFLKKRRYQQNREEIDKRFPFAPKTHPDVPDFSKDAKRIRKALELDDVCMVPGGDLFGMIDIMMLCAGHPISDGMPWDTKFLYAIQCVHDWHHGRTVPTDEEWWRVCKVLLLAQYVKEALDVIDEERKAGWPLRQPRNHRRLQSLAR